MNKLLLFVSAIILVSAQLLAQEPTFKAGDKVLNLGIGLGSTYYGGSGFSIVFPPISASLEVGVKDGVIDKGSIGVGGIIGYHAFKESGLYRTSDFILGGRGYFHYPLVEKLDTYTGLMLFYNISSSVWIGSGPELPNPFSYGGLRLAWFVGARYYLKDNLALMAELGYGLTILNFGVAFKI